MSHLWPFKERQGQQAGHPHIVPALGASGSLSETQTQALWSKSQSDTCHGWFRTF